MAYGGYYQSPEYYEAQERARQQRIEDKHDEKLDSLPNGGMGEWTAASWTRPS